MLRLPDKWVWDWWLADTGTQFHLFFLQAPRSLGEQIKRHRHATVGHAISTDLREWQVLPDALAPGPAGSWDDGSTWTGSTLNHEGLWYTFYTGVSKAQRDVQRVGLATSPDLLSWTRHPANPLIELDPRWYEELDHDVWRDQAWRDPWVFPDSGGAGFHALLTARAVSGAPDARGVIGHAWSANLVDWEVVRGPGRVDAGAVGHRERRAHPGAPPVFRAHRS